MSVHIYEDTWDVETETLQPLGFDESAFGPASYPLPPLRPSGRRVVASLRTVVIENPLVRIVLCPDLGGRIVQVVDLRTGREPLARPSALASTEAPPRGVRIDHGIEFEVVAPGRPNSMGTVEYALREPDEEENPGAVFLYETVVGTSLSWHGCLTLAPDSSSVVLEVRVTNRALGPSPCSPRFRVAGAGLRMLDRAEGIVAFDPAGDAGFALLPEPPVAVVLADTPGALGFDDSPLFPRETRLVRARLVPFSGIGEPAQVHPEIAWSGRGTPRIALQSARPRPGATVYVGLAGGQTLQAPLDLDPSAPFSADLSAAVDHVLVRGVDQAEAFRSDDASLSVRRPLPSALAGVLGEWGREGTAEGELAQAIKEGSPAPPASLAFRYLAALHDGHRLVRLGLLKEAFLNINQSLEAHADDALGWWLAALLSRLTSEEGGDRPELLNAHFLAPLEPSLRAEAYLAIPAPQGSDPNPLLRPLASDPDSLLDVLVRLLELGLASEAARLSDEALRHREIPLVRYLYAWSLATETRMVAEAAEQVRRASTAPVEPPYPWRPLELLAVRELATLFPDDERLRQLSALAERFGRA